MKKYAPLATLVAVVLLGAGLLVANMLSNPANQTTAAAPAAPAASAAAAVAPGDPAAAAAEPAPAPAPAEPAVVEKAYTGRSAGNEVTVAIAVKNGKAVAYACDGKKTEAWLEGTLTGDSLSLSGKTSSITATLDDKASFGTVTVDGKEWPFSAKGVASPAGLYEGRGNVDGVAARVGWIVQEDGSVTGVENAGGSPKPAAPLDPTNLGATMSDGSPVTVTALDGASTVVQR
ncbi:hypothetical protein [Pseudonocardia charpentierae]|uniref:Serine/threonine protein kinase n=1 Tax=Pseudonocardia charpentierae TaxID=3075545 RepID=A0ABU2NEF6_9PSEU|nr:hypothetical protein [Pseudonocardia sp. DSM 45834]MDT0352264.1 hypothetical protein [Pseudonocardia sp. DSM 45834]